MRPSDSSVHPQLLCTIVRSVFFVLGGPTYLNGLFVSDDKRLTSEPKYLNPFVLLRVPFLACAVVAHVINRFYSLAYMLLGATCSIKLQALVSLYTGSIER